MGKRKTKCGNISAIISGLFVGNKEAAKNRVLLDGFQIKGVVSIGGGGQIFSDLRHFHLGIKDRPSPGSAAVAQVANLFEEVSSQIEEMMVNGPVLLHCMAGMSRSPTFAIGFLMLKQGMTLNEAHQIVFTARPNVRIAPGLWSALEELEAKRERGE